MRVSTDFTQTSPRWIRWWVALVTLSAFGPYVAGGIRTEQLAVYGSLVAVLALGIPVIAKANIGTPIPILLTWGGYAAIGVGSAVAGAPNLTAYRSGGSLLAGADNLLLPFALVVVTWFWVSIAPGLDLVRTAAKVVVAVMAANAVLSVITFVIGYAAAPWLAMFWDSGNNNESVALLAAQMGRYSGIFGQPAEAGTAYSIAIFCLLYLVQGSEKQMTGRFAILATTITMGALLTTSKVFLLGGLPVLAFLVLRDRKRRTRLVLGAAFTAVGVYCLQALEMLPDWRGIAMIERLTNIGTGSTLRTLTAGRLGGRGTLDGPSDEILEHHPVFGVGVRGLAVAYDSEWLQALIYAGLVGAILAGLTFVLLLYRWSTLRDVLPREAWLLAGAVLLLLLGASFGIPSLSGNRVVTLGWVFLGLLVATRSIPRSKQPSAPATAGRWAVPAAR